jgi:hypothetical protein
MRGRFIPYSLLLLAFLTISTILLTQPVIRRVELEVERTSKVIARLFSALLISATTEKEVADIVRGVLKDVEFPIIVTDELGIPRAWQRVGVDPRKFTPEELNSPELLKNDPDFKRLLFYIGRLERLHSPIPIKRDEEIVGYIYYGEPRILDYFKLLPFFLMTVGILSFLGLFWAARSIQTYQLETLWTSFAKGLAHQMGTPVSALLGWFELLKAKNVDPEILEEIEKDISRLRSILMRFSKIGGGEKLTRVNLTEVVRETVEESKRRFLKDVDVDMELEEGVETLGDPELLSWSIENLLKNAYEARKPFDARIWVILEKDETGPVIKVGDNGKGIPKDKRKLLFKKSFSTKEKGWGMGLVLTRRIIEEIHKGRIRLIKSEPMRETVFEIRLPSHYHV